MKTLLLWLAAGLFTVAHAATNLVVNGDFETNALTPWTGVSASVTTDLNMNRRASLTTNSGRIEQSFATTAGTLYYVGATMAPDIISTSTGQVTVLPDAGGSVLGSRTASALIGGLISGRTGFVFTATTAMTKIVFTVTSPGITGTTSMTVDDVVVYELAPGKLAGRYSGTITTTTAITVPGAASTKFVTRIAARVTPEGLIVVLGGGTPSQGVVLSDGTLEIPALGVRATGAVKKGRISFTVPSPFPLLGLALTGSDASNTFPGTLPATSTTAYVLTRVGK